MSKNNPYWRFEGCKLILRDVLALDRTRLANKRTLLAYLRTAITLFIAAISFIKLDIFKSPWIKGIGWACIPIGMLFLVGGVYGYLRESKKLKKVLEYEAEHETDE